MKRTGPDSLTSWFIAGACCFINMMLFGMARLSGVLFVASVSRFHVSRKSASFPYAFSSFMRNISSPLVGYLGHKFGVRVVTAFGCILGAIGAAACYFAENITTVSILWGAVFGLGFGMGNILLAVSINEHFDKHRATASGINFSGACFGSLFLPPIVEVLLNKYGLSGTYLFLGGFILNCVPAALLLKKSNSENNSLKLEDIEHDERQSIVSGMKVKMYTTENISQKSDSISEIDKNVNFITGTGSRRISHQDSKDEESIPNLTYEERIKRLSTQTLLSEYSIHMSTSEPLDVDEIIENSKGRRQVDQTVLEAEVQSLSSQNTDQGSEKDEVFEKETRSSSVQYEGKVSSEVLDSNHKLSKESTVSEKAKYLAKKLKEGYANYGYQVEIDDLKLDSSKNFMPKKNIQRLPEVQSSGSQVYFSCADQNNKDNNLTAHYKDPKNKQNIRSISSEDIDNFKVRHGILSSPSNKEKEALNIKNPSALGSFSVIYDPTFLMIAITLGIYTFTFVCMVTVIVDFSHDLNIGASNEKYILMALSVGDLAGRLGLGWITDCGFMTSTSFAAFCFAFQGVVTAVIVLSDGFMTLTMLSALYGLSEAGIIVITPILIAQYIDQDKQTVAIPTSNVFSGPFCLAVAPLIGYFRDDIGSYIYIFYIISLLSTICCFGLLLLPYIARCRKRT